MFPEGDEPPAALFDAKECVDKIDAEEPGYIMEAPEEILEAAEELLASAGCETAREGSPKLREQVGPQDKSPSPALTEVSDEISYEATKVTAILLTLVDGPAGAIVAAKALFNATDDRLYIEVIQHLLDTFPVPPKLAEAIFDDIGGGA